MKKLMKIKEKEASASIEEFKAILMNEYKKNVALQPEEKDMCDPSTDAQLVVDCIADTFLGEDWYVTMPESAKQVNTVILFKILCRYNKEFKRWYNKTCKELMKKNSEGISISGPSHTKWACMELHT